MHTNATDSNYWLRRQEKRAVGTTIAITVAVVSLLTSIGSTIYFSQEMTKLRNYIVDVDLQMESDAKVTRNIALNVNCLKRADQLVGVRLDSLYGSLLRLQNSSACTLEKQFVTNQVTHLQDYFGTLYSEILQGRVSDKLIPLKALRKIISDSPQLSESLISTFPSTFYGDSRISLMSVDPKTKSIRLLLVSPNVQKTASYVSVNFLSPVATVRHEGKSIGMSLDMENNPVGLPIGVTRRKDFDILSLTKDDIGKMVTLNDCGTMSGVTYCRSIGSLPDSQKRCLEGLFLKNLDMQGSCRLQRVEGAVKGELSVVRGWSGMGITTDADFSAYSYDGKRVGAFLGGSSGKAKHYGQSVCVFIPSLHPQILVRSQGREQVLTQNSEIRISTVLGDHLEAYGQRHILWFPTEHETWFNNSYQNISETFANETWLSMKRQKIAIRRMTDRFSYSFYIIVGLLVWSCVLTSVVLYLWCSKSGCSQCCANQPGERSDSERRIEDKFDKAVRRFEGHLARTETSNQSMRERVERAIGRGRTDLPDVHFDAAVESASIRSNQPLVEPNVRERDV